MKTFHIGGTATRSVEASETKAKRSGKIKYHNLNVVKNPQEKNVAINSKGEILIIDAKERQIEKHSVVLGAEVLVKEGDSVAVRQTLTRWDPHMVPILAEMSGSIRFEDIEIGKTVREESDASTGFKRKVIMEHKGDLHPQIIIEDENGKISGLYPIPEKAHLEVEEGEKITPGTLLAKTPREISRTEDITGGLPRVAEICEARKPKDPAVMSEIEGVVELGEKRRGKRTIIVRGEGGMESEHLVPRGKHLKVHRGDLVKAGDPLVEGPLVLQDILRIRGEEELQTYMLKEVQNVYRSQNVPIDDKHIEIIIGQMLRKVKIEDAGDTNLLPGQIMDKFKFREENKKIKDMGGKPSTAKPLLLGITRASLQADSFISAASFQETTKVLTRAALEGKVDNLVGLKENVILGHLVPAGTGYKSYNTLYAISTDEVAIKEASKQKEELLEPTL
jgi:DNA-directed RNA polymerase subunit beta'